MGDWAKKTRLRWRWGQFRFETLYTTPDYRRRLTVTPRDGIWNPTIQSATTEIGKGAGKENDVQGRSSTGKHTLASPVDELVRWVPMLHWIHETTRASLESRALPDPSNQAVKTSDDLLRWRRVPASILRERSWDF